jgi:hypothetical protein
MPTSVTLTPYEVLQDLRFRIHDPYDAEFEREFSWEDRPSEEEGYEELDLRNEEQPWSKLDFTVRADISLNELGRLLPETTDPLEDLDLIVSVRCKSTKYRHVVPLVPNSRTDHRHSGEWSGDMSLLRRQVRNAVELVPLLVRKSEVLSQDVELVSLKKGAVLAKGRGVRLYIDESSRFRAGALKIRWEDFSASKNSWREEHDKDLFYLDPDPDTPELFLNKRYPELENILLGTADNGVDPALRHLSNSGIAQSVWTALFATAVGGIEHDSEIGLISSPTGWRGDVLESFLPHLFPNESSMEARLTRVIEMWESPDSIGPLMTRLGSAVQQVTGAHKLFQDAVRAVEEGGDR